MWIPLASAVRSDDGNCRPKELDEVPTGAGNREKVIVIRDISEDLQGCVVLKQKVHLYANATNVFEHVAELHVLRIRAKPVKSANVSWNYFGWVMATYMS